MGKTNTSRTIDPNDIFETLPRPFELADAMAACQRETDLATLKGFEQAVQGWIVHNQLRGRHPSNRRTPLYVPRSGRVDRTAETVLTAIEGRYEGPGPGGPSPSMAAAARELGDAAPNIGRAAAEVLGLSNPNTAAELRELVADGAITQGAAPTIYTLAKWLLAELRAAEENRRQAVAKQTGAEAELPRLETDVRAKGEQLCTELLTYLTAMQQAGRVYDASSIRQQVYNPLAKFVGRKVS